MKNEEGNKRNHNDDNGDHCNTGHAGCCLYRAGLGLGPDLNMTVRGANMKSIFNCPVCKNELEVGAVNINLIKKKSNSRLNDAMVIVNLCSEKVRELNKRKTKENVEKSREIAESIQNLLSDVLAVPEGVKAGIMDEMLKEPKKPKSKARSKHLSPHITKHQVS